MNYVDNDRLVHFIKLLRFHYYNDAVDYYRDPTGHELWNKIAEELLASDDDWFDGMEDEISEETNEKKDSSV